MDKQRKKILIIGILSIIASIFFIPYIPNISQKYVFPLIIGTISINVASGGYLWLKH